MNRIELIGVPGVPEVVPGADLATLIAEAAAAAGTPVRPGDILVISSKVVSKAEGRLRAATSRAQAVDDESVEVVAERLTPLGVTRIVRSRSGPVLAAAGVDASNVDPGTVLLLPVDPDASAARLHARLAELTGIPPGELGVIISDTAGRPWREGQTDLAIGGSGVQLVDDLRGGTDRLGNRLDVTMRALGDELAAAADLVKGKLDGVPVAVIRGFGRALGGVGKQAQAAQLVRGTGTDWFRFGHVEAARASIGVPPRGEVAPRPIPTDPPIERLRRAVSVALVGTDPFAGAAAVPAPRWGCSESTPGALRVQPHSRSQNSLALGALAQRVWVAAWAEDLAVQVEATADGGLVVTLAAPSPAGTDILD